MSGVFGKTVDSVEAAMRFRVARQTVLSGNIANADTPGYRRFDLALDEARHGMAITRTDPRHLGTGGIRGTDWDVERGDYGDRPDRNGVDIDEELIAMSRNAGAFVQQAEVLSRLLALRRIAVTGEPR